MPRRKALVLSPRALRNIDWIERHLAVPEGAQIGQFIQLRDWQKQIIEGIYGSPTRRAIISVGRKAGKTSLSAMLLCLHIVGPEAVPNSQLYSAAQSRDQAGITFNLAAKMLRQNPQIMRFVQIRETAKSILCPQLGTVYRALSAEAATAYGLSPVLTIHDELGVVRGPRSELYDALETASAAHANPLSIIISTQAPTDNDLLSILIDDAKQGRDPKVKLFFWTAPDDLDPFSEKAIKAANPAAGDFANLAELKSLAADAKRMPSREAEYRVLILNQRCESVSPFISKAIWDLNAGPVRPSFEGYPVYAGLDLSETSDLTALVLVAKIEDAWHIQPTCWLPAEGLAERARRDRVPYDLWYKQGFLATTPGRAIEYSYVAQYLFDLSQRVDLKCVAFDRFGYRHLKPWLLQAGFTEPQLETLFREFGQGFVSMAPAVRELETQLLQAQMRHGGHPTMTMCMANAVTEADPAGNRKLSKKRSRGRIDAAVALAMALSVAITAEHVPAFVSVWDDAALAEVMAA